MISPTFEPLLEASPLVLSHVATAFGALFLGTYQLAAPKGTFNHKVAGYIWAALMMWTAGVSLFIHGIQIIGPFSPIHLLSILTLVSVPLAVWAARKKRINSHRSGMRGLYFYALIVAGLLTFLPGRMMYRAVLGG